MQIQLSNSSKVAVLDSEDYERCKSYKWKLTRKGYAKSQVGSMHRFILNLSKENPNEVHHKDGNKLNNKKDNLQAVTHKEHVAIHKKSKSS